MNLLPIPPGKLPVGLLKRLFEDRATWPSDVLIGPAIGEDACVLDLRGGVLVAAMDPVTLTQHSIGRHAVIINANDIAATGVRPRWFLTTLLLPPGTSESEIEELFLEIHSALAELGASLVGGHSEITPSVTRPVVIGQMLGLADEGRFVSTAGARVADVILQVGPIPVEGAAVLAGGPATRLTEIDPAIVRAASAAIEDPGISVVEAALSAAELGATSMHDPTEGGLAAALHELAGAAGVSLQVDRTAVLWFEPGLALCDALGADPWSTLASGSLLAAFDPADADSAAEALAAKGYSVATIATAGAGSGVLDTEGRAIPWPQRDEVTRVLEG